MGRSKFFFLGLILFFSSCFKTPIAEKTMLEKDLAGKIPMNSLIFFYVPIWTYATGSSTPNKQKLGYLINTGSNDDIDYYLGLTLSNNIGKLEYYFPYFDGSGNDSNIDASNNDLYIGDKACMVAYSRATYQRIGEPLCGAILSQEQPTSTFYSHLTLNPPYEETLVYLFIGGNSVENSTEYFYLPPLHPVA